MKDIFIERTKDILRIAVKKDGRLMECYIEDNSDEPMPGEIYKGIVKNVIPAIKSAFIDIGSSKNAYMYLNKKVKKGQEIMVEVVKEGIGEKGPKVSDAVSIPGRMAVLHTYDEDISFSKKIREKGFMEKLRRELAKPEGVGVTVRTKAEGATTEEIQREVDELYNKYLEIKRTFEYTLTPKLISGENSIFYRILRDVTDESTESIYVESQEDYEFIKGYLKDKGNINVKLHNEVRSMFDYYGIEKEILALRGNRIKLHCGGDIVLEKTEALYAIDVNTGKNVHGGNIENTAYITNLEAAEEAVRQIRLRNLSGIIIIDFIDMKDEEHKNKIIKKLNEGFSTDSNKAVVHPFTELGLVQIARRRRGKNISEYIEEKCKECGGAGIRLKFDYVMLLIRNEIIRLEKENSIKSILIELNPIYSHDVQNDLLHFITQINGFNKDIYVKYTDSFEYFKVEPLIFLKQMEELKEYKLQRVNN